MDQTVATEAPRLPVFVHEASGGRFEANRVIGGRYELKDIKGQYKGRILVDGAQLSRAYVPLNKWNERQLKRATKGISDKPIKHRKKKREVIDTESRAYRNRDRDSYCDYVLESMEVGFKEGRMIHQARRLDELVVDPLPACVQKKVGI